MSGTKSKKFYRILNLSFKIVITLLSVSYLIYVLFYQKREFTIEETGQVIEINFAYVKNYLVQQIAQNQSNVILVFAALGIFILNFGSEIFKWKILMKQIFPVNFKLAFQSIFTGIAASNLTPYRIGGIFGRAAHVPFDLRRKALTLIVLGDVAQYIVTVFFGCSSIFLLLFLNDTTDLMLQQKTLLMVFASLLLFGSSLLLLFYFKMSEVLRFLERIKFFGRWKKFWEPIIAVSDKKINRITLYISAFRLFTITVQYCVIFKLLGMEYSWHTIFLLTNAMFIIYHFLPSLSIIELGMTKTAIMLFLIQHFVAAPSPGLNVALMVACSSFIIWVFNLLLPSLVGSYFLIKVKLVNDK